MDSREIFAKDKLSKEVIIEAAEMALDINKDDILFVLESEDWLKRDNKPVVIEYKGRLEEDDEYPGCYYYDIFFSDNRVLDKLKEFNNALGDNVIVTLK